MVAGGLVQLLQGTSTEQAAPGSGACCQSCQCCQVPGLATATANLWLARTAIWLASWCCQGMRSSSESVFSCLRFCPAQFKVHLPWATGCQAPELSMDLHPGPYSNLTPSPVDLQEIEASLSDLPISVPAGIF